MKLKNLRKFYTFLGWAIYDREQMLKQPPAFKGGFYGDKTKPELEAEIKALKVAQDIVEAHIKKKE